MQSDHLKLTGKPASSLISETLWYELCASAPKYIQTEIDSARSSVDFFVAMTYLSFLFAIVSLLLAIYERGPTLVFVASAGAFGLTLLSHSFAVRTTAEWGYSVQALVNLARTRLAEGLGLQVPETLEEEKVMWGLATSYVFSPNPDAGAYINRFRKKNDKNAQDGCDTGMPVGQRSDANRNFADEGDRDSEADDLPKLHTRVRSPSPAPTPWASVRRKARLPRITGAIALPSVTRLAGPDREIRRRSWRRPSLTTAKSVPLIGLSAPSGPSPQEKRTWSPKPLGLADQRERGTPESAAAPRRSARRRRRSWPSPDISGSNIFRILGPMLAENLAPAARRALVPQARYSGWQSC